MRAVAAKIGAVRALAPGRDQRDAARVSQIDQARFRHAFGRHAVTLQLDVETVAEQALQHLAARKRERGLSGADRGIALGTGGNDAVDEADVERGRRIYRLAGQKHFHGLLANGRWGSKLPKRPFYITCTSPPNLTLCLPLVSVKLSST